MSELQYMSELQFRFLGKHEICDLGKDWDGYRLNFEDDVGLSVESHKNGTWEHSSHPPEFYIQRLDTSTHDLMILVQEIAEAIGAELVVVRDAAHSLSIDDPNHQFLTTARVAFARPNFGRHG